MDGWTGLCIRHCIFMDDRCIRNAHNIEDLLRIILVSFCMLQATTPVKTCANYEAIKQTVHLSRPFVCVCGCVCVSVCMPVCTPLFSDRTVGSPSGPINRCPEQLSCPKTSHIKNRGPLGYPSGYFKKFRRQSRQHRIPS